MNKPVPETKTALDYHKCRNYLQEKYGYDERNYAGWEPGTGDERPYQDFWHYVLDRCDYITNGCYFGMEKEYFLEGLEEDDFRYIITMHYFNEFGEGKDDIEFWVEW